MQLVSETLEISGGFGGSVSLMSIGYGPQHEAVFQHR
jgi:hypothetical protein